MPGSTLLIVTLNENEQGKYLALVHKGIEFPLTPAYPRVTDDGEVCLRFATAVRQLVDDRDHFATDLQQRIDALRQRESETGRG